MSFMSSSRTSLAVTVAQAVSYLISPLTVYYSSTTIFKLRTALEAGLASVYAATWVPEEPLRGSGRRCLSFSPQCLPPRPIYNACVASGVEWSEWSKLLGGVEFDMFVDPGCVSIRPGSWMPGTVAKITTVWSDELEFKAQVKAELQGLTRLHMMSQNKMSSKTLSELLIEDDAADEEELFSRISKEVRSPAWMTPLLEQFPVVPSIPSRASSRNSLSSSEFSVSSEESFDSYRSFASRSVSSSSTDSGSNGSSVGYNSSTRSLPFQKVSRRERVRQARVFVDNTKVEVTPYDGGKTTVLTGGVMLGVPPAGAKSYGRKTMRRN